MECNGDGEIVEERGKRIDELTDAQIRFLLEADMFRETGGKDQEELMEEAKQDMPGGFGSMGGMGGMGAPPPGGSIPNVPGSF